MFRPNPRAQVAVLLAFLVSLSLVRPGQPTALACHAAVAIMAVLLSGAAPYTARALAVLPFGLPFALLLAWQGRGEQAADLLLKSLLSALAVVTATAHTPIPELLDALRRLGAPAFVVEVAQLVWRYLATARTEAQRMARAASCRGGRHGAFSLLRESAGGIVAALFGRALRRAEGVSRAMYARGYRGAVPALHQTSWRPADSAFCIAGLLLLAACHLT